MQTSINKIMSRIADVLHPCVPSIYLYGSVVLDDFKLGWSDIDILVLTQESISEDQANQLVYLRQMMLAEEPDNPYYRSFEGGILPLNTFLSGEPDRVVYWGTSGERITDHYTFDSFSMTELLESSVLLFGKDLRSQLKAPTYDELYTDVKRHYEAIRQHAQETDRSLYSYGWMLDIARCIYTLRTGKIIAKTKAAEWALANNLCPDRDALITTLEVRRNPLGSTDNPKTFDYAQTLSEPIQRFADVLEKELDER